MAEHWEVIASGNIVTSNSAEELWENAVKYFKWCSDNPIKVKETLRVGKMAGSDIEVTKTRPYSIKALCAHCGIMEDYLFDIRNSKDIGSLYYVVVSKIIALVYIQNSEMATVGEFNPIFTAKMLNMDRDESPSTAITVNVVTDTPVLSRTENEVLEKLEMEKGSLKAGDV